MRLVAYIAVMVATLLAAGETRTDLAAFALIAEGAILAVCLAHALLLRCCVSARVEPASARVPAGGEARFDVVVENRALVPGFACRVPVTVRNLWGAPACAAVIAVAVGPRGRAPAEARHTLSLGPMSCAGPLELEAGPAEVRDFLGIFRLHAGSRSQANALVMPAGAPLRVEAGNAPEPAAVAAAGAADAPRGGAPMPPEYADVRPYQPGDNVRAIHWKLSARTDELMARAFEPESAPVVCLLIDCGNFFARDSERLGAVLEGAAAVLRGMEAAGVRCDAVARVSVSSDGGGKGGSACAAPAWRVCPLPDVAGQDADDRIEQLERFLARAALGQTAGSSAGAGEWEGRDETAGFDAVLLSSDGTLSRGDEELARFSPHGMTSDEAEAHALCL